MSNARFLQPLLWADYPRAPCSLCESHNGLSWHRVSGDEPLGSCFGPNPDW